MSGDFALAIEEGATRIRMGTALFGKRAPHRRDRVRNEYLLCCARRATGVTLAVRAQPGAKKTAIIGIYGEGSSAK